MLTEEKGIQYGYDKNARKIQAKNGEPIYGLKNGTPFLEIICPNYEELKYNEKDHVFEKVPAGTEMFHLDADKNRDSRTAPYTGMAYAVSYTHLDVYKRQEPDRLRYRWEPERMKKSC